MSADPFDVMNYGGGRQTVAMLLLIKLGLLPAPDRIIIANTGREKTSTWDYLSEIGQPIAESFGMTIEIAPRNLAYVDLYGHNGDLLLPVYTLTGKLSTYCSSEWKASVITRYIKLTSAGYTLADIESMPNDQIKKLMRSLPSPKYTNWIGFASDEAGRIKDPQGKRFPLIDLMMSKASCQELIIKSGLPMPPPSSCYICPNMTNEQWRQVRDDYPGDFEEACKVDEEVRATNEDQGMGPVWLHHSRVPLREANLDTADRKSEARQCGLGLCYV